VFVLECPSLSDLLTVIYQFVLSATIVQMAMRTVLRMPLAQVKQCMAWKKPVNARKSDEHLDLHRPFAEVV
jgi:hypothetical protein